jgi:hypothetical protein
MRSFTCTPFNPHLHGHTRTYTHIAHAPKPTPPLAHLTRAPHTRFTHTLSRARPRSHTRSHTRPNAGDTALAPVADPGLLPPREALRLAHASALVALSGMASAGVEVRAASALPPPTPATHFRGQFYFARAGGGPGGVLYVRRGDLAAAGDLTLALLHALAVVKVRAGGRGGGWWKGGQGLVSAQAFPED